MGEWDDGLCGVWTVDKLLSMWKRVGDDWGVFGCSALSHGTKSKRPRLRGPPPSHPVPSLSYPDHTAEVQCPPNACLAAPWRPLHWHRLPSCIRCPLNSGSLLEGGAWRMEPAMALKCWSCGLWAGGRCFLWLVGGVGWRLLALASRPVRGRSSQQPRGRPARADWPDACDGPLALWQVPLPANAFASCSQRAANSAAQDWTWPFQSILNLVCN